MACLPALFGERAAHDVGVDRARGHRVDGDAVLADLTCQRAGHAEHGRLGRRIGHLAVGAAATLRGRGGDTDDAAEPVGHHRGHDAPGDEVHPAHVHRENAIPLRRGEFEKRGRRTHPRHIGQTDDLRELGHDALYGRVDRGLVRDIRRQADARLTVVSAELFGEAPGRSAVDVQDGDRPAGTGQPLRKRAADAPRGRRTGDHRGAVGGKGAGDGHDVLLVESVFCSYASTTATLPADADVGSKV
jgi:hypothetical protein